MRQNELKFNPACMRMSNLKIKYFGGKRNMFVMGHSKPKSNPDSAGMPNLKIKSNIKIWPCSWCDKRNQKSILLAKGCRTLKFNRCLEHYLHVCWWDTANQNPILIAQGCRISKPNSSFDENPAISWCDQINKLQSCLQVRRETLSFRFIWSWNKTNI